MFKGRWTKNNINPQTLLHLLGVFTRNEDCFKSLKVKMSDDKIKPIKSFRTIDSPSSHNALLCIQRLQKKKHADKTVNNAFFNTHMEIWFMKSD